MNEQQKKWFFFLKEILGQQKKEVEEEKSISELNQDKMFFGMQTPLFIDNGQNEGPYWFNTILQMYSSRRSTTK